MKTGRIVAADADNKHLGKDRWIEIYPECCILDIERIQSIPSRHKAVPRTCNRIRQTPILVRLTWWKGSILRTVCQEAGQKADTHAEH